MSDQHLWGASASIINTLWGGILPRLAANAWLRDSDDDSANDPAWPAPGERMESFLRSEMDVLVPPGGNGNPFAAQVNAVRAYLDQSTAIPIYYGGTGGYDFILSDCGIDIFIPEPPDRVEQILHWYTIRRTGEFPIGLPSLAAEAVGTTLVSVAAPTGASQQTLRRQFVSHQPDGAVATSTVDGDAGDRNAGAVLAQECGHAWELEGSVYRQILSVHPRVVAQVWYERTTYPTDNEPPWTLGARFDDTGDEGLRAIFAERLETSIPPLSQMRFRQTENPPQGSGLDSVWSVGDVNITNLGFHFPRPGTAPSRDDLLELMATGKAGNVVFTNSGRPGGTG